MIVAIDFDGTLFQNVINGIVPHNEPLPIGEPIHLVIELMKALRLKGHKVTLFTCREGSHLSEAVKACESHGLTFDSINESIPEISFRSRKLYADFYIDDRAMMSCVPQMIGLNDKLGNDEEKCRLFLETIDIERLIKGV